MLYTSDLYSDVCQLFLNKPGKSKNWVRCQGSLLGDSVIFLLTGLRIYLVVYRKWHFSRLHIYFIHRTHSKLAITVISCSIKLITTLTSQPPLILMVKCCHLASVTLDHHSYWNQARESISTADLSFHPHLLRMLWQRSSRMLILNSLFSVLWDHLKIQSRWRWVGCP